MSNVYRAYHLDPASKIAGPPTVIDASDDDVAVEQARALLDGRAVELWFGTRRVAVLQAETAFGDESASGEAIDS